MLAGDVLLTEAFEVIANASATPQICVAAARALGAGAGSRGMVYGQELDLKYEALAATEEQLRLIHRNKTGALINAAVQMGDVYKRQALFHHTAALPEMLQELAQEFDLTKIDAVGVSQKPRPVEGSYMPCFLAGVSAATAFAAARDIPLIHTTHQQGHAAAADVYKRQPVHRHF